ncbi:hypothetical protein H4582DRAFT_282052 [Lactarius indigo]|nr:hypothetical protein H4582DRAFT_282052 [Lactarius indigo]
MQYMTSMKTKDPNIRIEGYKAIVRMSEEQPRWLERNSRRAGAIATERRTGCRVIEMALIQHLELDSKVTLGVLCDQIVPQTTPWETKTRSSASPSARSLLRSSPRTHGRPLFAQLQDQGRGFAEQEAALIDTLIKVVSKYPAVDVAKHHPGHPHLSTLVQRRTQRAAGIELVQLLFARAASALREDLKEDLAPGQNPASLEQSHGYLELSDLLCRTKGAADPAQLLRFYCTSSLMGKMTLRRLSQESRAFFVARLAGALAACSHQKSPESSELALMRRQVVDALSVSFLFSPKWPHRTRKRGGRAKFYYRLAVP